MLQELPGRRSSAISIDPRRTKTIWMSVISPAREVFYLGQNGHWRYFGSQERFRAHYYHTKATANV